MELGSWSLITAPSLLALIPLIVMIVLIFIGKSNVSGIMVGVLVGALLMGQDLGDMAAAFSTALGSSTALIGLIIMMGAGLGVLMNEAGVTHTLVYWIVKRIGVNTQTKGKIALVIVSIIVCGLLGTLGGGNAVIAPVMLPIMASLGVTPTVVATLFKVAGEIGLILGPLTGVTLITEEVTGLSYGQLMIQAAIPFAIVWLAGAWVGANRAQKRTHGKESYTLGDDVKHLDQVVITKQQKVTTIAFLLCFVLLVGYGIATGQGTSYALIVMIVLAAVVAIFGRIEIDRSVDCITKGVASQANMFLIFVSIEVLLNLVTLGGGFDALSNLLGGPGGQQPHRRHAGGLCGGRLRHRGGRRGGDPDHHRHVRRSGHPGGPAHGLLRRLHPGGHPAHRLRLSHHQLCRPAGHRPVHQHQGGPPGRLDQRGLCLGVRHRVCHCGSHDPGLMRKNTISVPQAVWSRGSCSEPAGTS